MSLLKSYVKWLSEHTVRKYDLAELLSLVFFLSLILYGIKFNNFYFFMILFLTINLFQLCNDLLRKILGKFNTEIPKWINTIPIVFAFLYILIYYFIKITHDLQSY